MDAKEKLRLCQPLLRSTSEPPYRFCIVLRNALTLIKGDSYVELRSYVALLCGYQHQF